MASNPKRARASEANGHDETSSRVSTSDHESSSDDGVSDGVSDNVGANVSINGGSANDNDDADGEYNSDESEEGIDDDDDEDESDVEVETVALPDIQVEFEARTPEPADFGGIKRFLFKLFNNSCKIDYSGLTNYIIHQRKVGSVVTQSYSDYSGDEDDANPNGLPSAAEISKEVYGLATVIKLLREKTLTKGIIEYLVQIAQKDEGNLTKLSSLLCNDASKSVGLVISERIMNVPPQLSVPLYETLFNEIRKARARNMPHFDFTHYVLICRILTPPGLQPGSPEAVAATIHQNPEEEVFLEECDDVIEADLSQLDGETYNDMVGLNGIQYKTRCCLIVFKADKTTHIWEKIKEAFPIPT